MRPLACGECAGIQPIPSSSSARPICVGSSSTASSAASTWGRFTLNMLCLSVVGIELQRAAPALQVAPQHAQIRFRAVVFHETRVRLAGGVINHRHPVELRPSPFQPVVFRGVPLHQLAAAAPSRPPHVHLLHLPPLHPPHPAPISHWRSVSLLTFTW